MIEKLLVAIVLGVIADLLVGLFLPYPWPILVGVLVFLLVFFNWDRYYPRRHL